MEPWISTPGKATVAASLLNGAVDTCIGLQSRAMPLSHVIIEETESKPPMNGGVFELKRNKVL